jgi:hypothetical protein
MTETTISESISTTQLREYLGSLNSKTVGITKQNHIWVNINGKDYIVKHKGVKISPEDNFFKNIKREEFLKAFDDEDVHDRLLLLAKPKVKR